MGPRPRAGSKGLAHALKTFRASQGALHHSDPRKALSAEDIDAAQALIEALGAALAPLESSRAQPFTAIAALHAAALGALSKDDTGVEAAFAGTDGAELGRAFEDIAAQTSGLHIKTNDYAGLFATAIADRTCRRAGRPGTRVQIFGLLEARLVNVDRVVVGALVESVWPPEARSDPWLSRPMRLELPDALELV